MRFVGIDPATRTGLVALDENGNVLLEVELKGKSDGPKEKGGISIAELVSLENMLFQHLLPGDEIIIEQPAMGTQKGVTTGMIHGGIRTMIQRRGLSFNECNPKWTKKYVKVTDFVGEVGSKRRLKGPEKKKAVKEAVLQHFCYTHKSDNVIDAYILARVALNLYRCREYMMMVDTLPYQVEVVNDILSKAK